MVHMEMMLRVPLLFPAWQSNNPKGEEERKYQAIGKIVDENGLRVLHGYRRICVCLGGEAEWKG